ncbi:MAG: cysteine desulfurase [Patescibacteria group bacterium]|jgi:cysteine desulfurase/selenocysteine lyase
MRKQLGQNIKKDFPIFKNNPGLVFLDSGASAQKPQAVIRAITDCYEKYYANVHRGIYKLSEKSSAAYESVRAKAAGFINAGSEKRIVFTRNTTESINLVAYTWGRQNIRAGDEILLTEMEHHANMLPWRVLAKEKKASVKYWPINQEGRLDLNELDKLLTKKTKLVAFTQMSNVLGTINPAKEIIKKIRSQGSALVLIDGAQSVPHFSVDVRDLDADFYVFSSHKMCGPTGVGVLYAKDEILEKMNPFLYGGDMIANVTLQEMEWSEVPAKFEAGTPAIAEVIGFGAAIDYLQDIGMDNVFKYEEEMVKAGLRALLSVEGLKLFGPHEPEARGAVFAFEIPGVHPHDAASIFDEQNIAVRAGHHCAQPLHQKLGIPASLRASFYLYNTLEDLNKLISGIKKAQEIFGL